MQKNKKYILKKTFFCWVIGRRIVKDGKHVIKFYKIKSDSSLKNDTNKNGEYKTFYVNDYGIRQVLKINKYKNNELDSEQKTFYRNSEQLKKIEIYENGKQISETFFDKEGKNIPKQMTQDCQFKGNLNDYMQNFMPNVIKEINKIPENEIEGNELIINFSVNEKGKNQKISIEKSIHPIINIMLKEHIKLSSWIPKIEEGENLETKVTFFFDITKYRFKYYYLFSNSF